MQRWIYRLSDGYFLRGGYYPPDYDPTREALAVFEDGQSPDPLRERFDPTSPTLKRPATQAEIDAVLAEQDDYDFEGHLVMRALVRVTYNYLPPAIRSATFQAFADEVKAEYRRLRKLSRG